jgi:hypothetical protein
MAIEPLSGIETETLPATGLTRPWGLQWTSVIVGAFVATALSLILISFGTALGLGMASAAPTWRDASVALWLLSGVYLIFQSLISFGCGGYVAGRVRPPYASATDDIETRTDCTALLPGR